jgi:hypothetical protein
MNREEFKKEARRLITVTRDEQCHLLLILWDRIDALEAKLNAHMVPVKENEKPYYAYTDDYVPDAAAHEQERQRKEPIPPLVQAVIEAARKWRSPMAMSDRQFLIGESVALFDAIDALDKEKP